MSARVVVLLIENEDFAWEVFNAAHVAFTTKAVMVNPDDPHTIAEILSLTGYQA